MILNIQIIDLLLLYAMCDVNKASEDKQKKKDSSYSSFVFLSLSNCKHYNVR